MTRPARCSAFGSAQWVRSTSPSPGRSGEGPADDSVAKSLAAYPEVLEVHHVAGEDCYLVKVRTKDAEQLGSMLRTRIGRIPGVRSTRTTIVLETVKETSRLELARLEEAGS